MPGGTEVGRCPSPQVQRRWCFSPRWCRCTPRRRCSRRCSRVGGASTPPGGSAPPSPRSASGPSVVLPSSPARGPGSGGPPTSMPGWPRGIGRTRRSALMRVRSRRSWTTSATRATTGRLSVSARSLRSRSRSAMRATVPSTLPTTRSAPPDARLPEQNFRRCSTWLMRQWPTQCVLRARAGSPPSGMPRF